MTTPPSGTTVTDSDDVLWWKSYYIEKLQTSDRVVGSVLILAILVGLLGNGSAVCYFWSRRKRTIHDLLYLAITTVDFLTVLLVIPVVLPLFNYRYSMLFKSKVFCTACASVIMFTARMSMFLAMMICITRTIAMKCPNRILSRFWVIGVIVGYATYMLVIYLIYLPQRWQYGEYYFHLSSCILETLDFTTTKAIFATYFGMISFAVELTLPSLITFVCFVVSTRVLMTRPALNNETDKRIRRVSVTISIFTAVFLALNIPCFLYQIWEILGALSILPFDSEIFDVIDVVYLYLQFMLQFFPIYLNAAINPLLYLLRMRGYQNWIRQALKRT